jgi:hypothetical protein
VDSSAVATSPIEAEASGQDVVTATYGGADFRIPLDVDTWPLELLLTGLRVEEKQLVGIQHSTVIAVIRELLGDQWPAFKTVGPRRRDVVAASNLFAAAVGVEKSDPLDGIFGAIPRRLIDLQEWPEAVEATLAGLGFDYRDRYRFQAGRRQLTFRQIHVHLTYAPYDSPLAIAKNKGRRPHSDAALAIFDLYSEMFGKPHPSRPMPEAERRARLAFAAKQEEAREASRRRMHGSGEQKQSAVAAARSNARAQQRREAHAQ